VIILAIRWILGSPEMESDEILAAIDESRRSGWSSPAPYPRRSNRAKSAGGKTKTVLRAQRYSECGMHSTAPRRVSR
jgi:hypothetical protein